MQPAGEAGQEGVEVLVGLGGGGGVVVVGGVLDGMLLLGYVCTCKGVSKWSQ